MGKLSDNQFNPSAAWKGQEFKFPANDASDSVLSVLKKSMEQIVNRDDGIFKNILKYEGLEDSSSEDKIFIAMTDNYCEVIDETLAKQSTQINFLHSKANGERSEAQMKMFAELNKRDRSSYTLSLTASDGQTFQKILYLSTAQRNASQWDREAGMISGFRNWLVETLGQMTGQNVEEEIDAVITDETIKFYEGLEQKQAKYEKHTSPAHSANDDVFDPNSGLE